MPGWKPTAEQRRRWQSSWASCDRCGKWRLLLGVAAADLPTGEWWCGHATLHDPARRNCDAPQELTDAAIDGEEWVQFAGGMWLHQSTAPKSTTGYSGVVVTDLVSGAARFAAVTKGNAARLGTFATAVEGAVCIARYRQEELGLVLSAPSSSTADACGGSIASSKGGAPGYVPRPSAPPRQTSSGAKRGVQQPNLPPIEDFDEGAARSPDQLPHIGRRPR